MELELYIPEAHRMVKEHASPNVKDDLKQGPEHHMWGEVTHYCARKVFPESTFLDENLSQNEMETLAHIYGTEYL